MINNPIWFYIKTHKKAFSLGMFFLLITNTLDGLYPLIIKAVIDMVVQKAPYEDIFRTTLLFFFSLCALAVTRYLWRVYFGRYHTLAAEDVRNRIFCHITKMGPQFFSKNPVGELMSLITNDVQSFRQGIGSGILILVDALTIVCVILPVMISLNLSWTLKCLIFLPIVPFLIQKVTHLIFSNYKNQQDSLSALSGVSQEIIAGIRVIKSFAQEKTRLKIYNLKSQDYELKSNKTAQVDAFFSPVMEFGVASGTVILLFIAADDVISGAASIGTLVAFQRYIQKMIWPMTAFGMGFSQLQKGMASFSRIKNVLTQNTDIPDLGLIDIQSFESLEVKNLTYQFSDSSTPILKNINFKISKGQIVYLVGPVGAGKTTLLHLLNRLYPSESGCILINGTSIEKISQRSLHTQLVLVTQEPFLFSESIVDNIRYADSEMTSSESHKEWAQLVDIDKEIEALPESFESQLGERGVNLSGGQKQRLTIARGLITRAPFIMLDDSLSAVDTKTEKAIKDRLMQKNKLQTQLIVTHRLNAAIYADMIIVLNNGEVEAVGKHFELLKVSPTYSKLCEIQGYSTVGQEIESTSGGNHE